MAGRRKRAPLVLDTSTKIELTRLAASRTEAAQRVERAKMLLAYAAGESVTQIARAHATHRPKVERCIDKALEVGPLTALADLPGRGRKPTITPEARAWVVSLACQKPKDLGYSYELWTTTLLAQHVRDRCVEAGHPSLARLGRGTVSKLLRRAQVRPHKIDYYLERRDPDFEAKMAQVLCVYREIDLLRKRTGTECSLTAVVSYDEKPGIQAIATTAPDLPPVPGGEHPRISRDYEYVRHGTVTLMAGIDLLTGHVHGQVVDRHRSREFVDFLRRLDAAYPVAMKIRLILDNHSAHVSKETRSYLASIPNRFEFVFTPKHGSWLNLIESFFGKMAKTMLRGIRVASKDELRERIRLYLDEINVSPVIFHWSASPDSLAVA
jgi:transposase